MTSPHPITTKTRRAFPKYLAADFPAYAGYVHGLHAAPFQRQWASAMADPDKHRLAIVAPPESGKTAWCIAYCAWLVGRDPSVHIGYVGNTASQALRQSVAVRDTVRSNPRFAEVFPGVALDESKGTSEREWFVRRPNPGDKDATFIATGFRGPLLGARLDLVVLDDYSDQENTRTPDQQERAWDWLQQNALTRLNPDRGRLICIQTRWAEGDVVGCLEDIGAELLHFPAITGDGEPLWPQRWRKDGLEKRRREIGSRHFDLHYMGIVLPREGYLFRSEWWSYWDASLSHPNPRPDALVYPGPRWDGSAGHPDPRSDALVYLGPRWDGSAGYPKPRWIALSVDTAAKTGIANDYSAATVWALANPAGTRPDVIPAFDCSHYLLHAWRDKLEFPELLRTVESMARQWSAQYVIVEDKGTGQPLAQELRRRGINVIAANPTTDKVSRAIGVTPTVEAGKVLLPRHAGWLDDFRYELETFPHARHDDWVDTLVQYLEWATAYASRDTRIWV